MQLAIFDVDGTLTQSSAIDERCFIRAFAEEFDIHDSREHWQACQHVTDSGLTEHIFQTVFGRGPTPEELTRLQNRFKQGLLEAVAAEPDCMPQIAGAGAAFDHLCAQADWGVAIATGCWGFSAQLKLRHARINYAHLPFGCADQWLAREEILNDAILQAESHYQTVFDRVVYIGDALWDVHATRKLNLPFVGVGAGERAAQLRAAGASHLIPDFNDLPRFLSALQEARVPQ
jgi:phosphoglycolate phosphatase-like HAD superfamily hydrolase